MTGVIVKGIGGFYYVESAGTIYECRARGRFRLEEITPLAGDRVDFRLEKGKGYVENIHPRKNELVRPRAANIDLFVLVMSAYLPRPDFLLADKLLIQAHRQGVEWMIILNKCDHAENGVLEQVRAEYGSLGGRLLFTSAVTRQGIEDLKKELRGKLSCFAGQSAVGKSSVLNSVSSRFDLETGELSKKSGRGKHTTRAAELLKLEGGGYVLDTPGFSLLEYQMEPEELQQHYPEMRNIQSCRFPDCLHYLEPDCTVKELRGRGLTKGRYDRYITLLKELIEKRKHRYD